MFPSSRKIYYFAFTLVVTCWLDTVGLVAAQGYCGITEEVKSEVGDTIKNCIKTLNIVVEEHLKDMESKFDDKGLTLCALQKLNLAKEDGTVDKDKLLKFVKISDAGFGKAVQTCITKSDSELKGESDVATKAKKKAAFFVVCMNKDFCKDKKQ